MGNKDGEIDKRLVSLGELVEMLQPRFPVDNVILSI